jgi:tetratricopeptide (TPR) repeat protein
VRARRRSAPEFTLLVLALIAYLPVCGIWSLNAEVAEHWVYLASVFLFAAVAIASVNFARTHSLVRPVRIAMSIALTGWAGFLAGRTFVRTFDWRDQRTFLERTIAAGGDSARMLINLGGLELSEGHLDKAKAALQMALKKEPDQPIAIINLAAVAIKQNEFSAARALLTRATNMPVVDGRAHELLAVLESRERGDANLMRMRLASRTGPSDWSIERRYIRLLDEAGATAGAIQEVQHCLATEWYRADSWLLLSQLLKKSGHAAQAAEALSAAERYDAHLSEHAL